MSRINLSTLPPNPTTEQIAALYRKLTGKDPTAEELDELKREAATNKPARPMITPDAEEKNADWPKRTKDVTLTGAGGTPKSGYTIYEVLLVLAILTSLGALATIGITGVVNESAERAKKAKVTSYTLGGYGGFHTIKIDGCEYVAYGENMMGTQSRVYTITHKGNCSNPIHKYNAEEPNAEGR